MRLQWIHLWLKLRIAQHSRPRLPSAITNGNMPSAFGRAAIVKKMFIRVLTRPVPTGLRMLPSLGGPPSRLNFPALPFR